MLNRLREVGAKFNQAVKLEPETPEVDVLQTVQAWTAGSAQIVDVREPDEWSKGHIPNAIHIPLSKLGDRAKELDRARPVIAVCQSGRRSLIAAEALIEAGFADAASLAGGMIAWTEAKQPVTW